MNVTWIENDLDGALALARGSGRRTLVWWTAAWCPPCNELESAIFSGPLFAERSRHLVLVRVDGDSAAAQLIADRLGVRSYPTPLILDRGGEEVVRLPGGLSEAEFDALLAMVEAHGRPLESIVAQARAGAALAEAELTLLAHHWWAVDERHVAGDDRVPFLLSLFRRGGIPSRLRARFLGHVLTARKASGAGVLRDSEDAIQFLASWLRSDEVRYSDAYGLLVDPTVLDSLAANGSAAREGLDEALLRAAEGLDASGRLTHTERLITLSAILALRTAREGAAAAQAGMRSRIRDAAAQADAQSRTVAQRQTAMNMAGHLLRAGGMADEAYTVFRAEAERSPHGPYFMPYLAGIDFARGRVREGMEWLRRSWSESAPGATRFERGAQYVARALQSDSSQGLREDILALMAEIGAAPDNMAGRNRSTLKRLLETLAAHAPLLRGESHAPIASYSGEGDELVCVGGVCEIPVRKPRIPG